MQLLEGSAPGAFATASHLLPPAPPVPVPALQARSGSGSGRASSSSTQEAAGTPDVEDSGLAPSSAHRVSAPHVAAASLVLARPTSVISFQPEHLSAALAAQEEEDNGLRVLVDSKERLRWSPELHQRFCHAVESLGGCAVAKPKDIVSRMNVPGLTLAHVKSHLQKYRQQEGVTFVAHAPRHVASGMRRLHSGYGAAADSWSDAPPAKRYCPDMGAQSHHLAPHHIAAPPAQHPYSMPSSGPSMWAGPQDAPPPPLPPASSEPLQHFFHVLSSAAQQQHQVAPPLQLSPSGEVPLPALPPMMPPALVQPQPGSPPPARVPSEQADRLHELADLALAQHDDLLAQQGAVQEAAAVLHGVHQQLQHAQQQQTSQQQSGVAARADALAARQRQLSAELSRHLAQQAALLEQLEDLKRCTHELIASPELAAAAAAAAPAGPPPPAGVAQQQQAIQPAAAAAPPAAPPAAAESTVNPHLASLVAMVAAAAAANYSAAACAPTAGSGVGPANPALAQLHQLLLSVRQ